MTRGMIKRFGIAVATAAVVLSLSASAALAGEITGNGDYIAGSDGAELKGQSHCAYSGLNDEYYVYGITTDPRTQSWGQIARHLQGAAGGVPGFACRGN